MSHARALDTLELAEGLYNELISHGADITIVFEWRNKDGSWMLKPIDLGAIMEVEWTERIDHFMKVALEQRGEDAVAKLTGFGN